MLYETINQSNTYNTCMLCHFHVVRGSGFNHIFSTVWCSTSMYIVQLWAYGKPRFPQLFFSPFVLVSQTSFYDRGNQLWHHEKCQVFIQASRYCTMWKMMPGKIRTPTNLCGGSSCSLILLTVCKLKKKQLELNRIIQQ